MGLMPESTLVKMTAKKEGNCAECRTSIEEHDTIYYDYAAKKAYCQECGKELSE